LVGVLYTPPRLEAKVSFVESWAAALIAFCAGLHAFGTLCASARVDIDVRAWAAIGQRKEIDLPTLRWMQAPMSLNAGNLRQCR
jgi:hypothetical protein